MILVTGATGKIGRLVVDDLLDMDIQVRAFVRNEDAFKGYEHPLLEIAVGTFEDVMSLKQAIEGVDSIFLVARDNPDQVIQHQNVIKVAEKKSVKHIVKLSALGAAVDSRVALMRWHAETEEQLKTSKLNWTFLRPQLYMQNLLRFGDSVASSGDFVAPMGSKEYALIDIRDIAAVAAIVLKDVSSHVSKVYTLSGPQAVTYKEIAAYLSNTLRKEVKYTPVSQKQFFDALIDSGTPSWHAHDLAFIADAYTGDNNKLVTDDVNQLLKRRGRNVSEFFVDYQDSFK